MTKAPSKVRAKWRWRGDHEEQLSLGPLTLAHVVGTEAGGYHGYLDSGLRGVNNMRNGNFRPSKTRDEAKRAMEIAAMEWLKKTGLGKFVSMPGGDLPQSQSNILHTGRRIALGPRTLESVE